MPRVTIAALQEEIDRLRKALEFYADPKMYQHYYVDKCCQPPVIYNDRGAVARQALEATDENLAG